KSGHAKAKTGEEGAGVGESTEANGISSFVETARSNSILGATCAGAGARGSGEVGASGPLMQQWPPQLPQQALAASAGEGVATGLLSSASAVRMAKTIFTTP